MSVKQDFKVAIRWYEQLESTNDTCAELAASGAAAGTIVAAQHQTRGRGQRGNTWSSAPDQNLTFSLLLRPTFLRVDEQFGLTQAVAVALCRYIASRLPSVAQPVAIKWPNDIYIGDHKVAGVLIENSFSTAMLEVSVVGIGINLNQRVFPPQLPNPTSLALHGVGQLMPSEELPIVGSELMFSFSMLRDARDAIGQAYMERLYRFGQLACYRHCASGELFEATMVGISPIGELLLQTADGACRAFGFKEVAFVL